MHGQWKGKGKTGKQETSKRKTREQKKRKVGKTKIDLPVEVIKVIVKFL